MVRRLDCVESWYRGLGTKGKRGARLGVNVMYVHVRRRLVSYNDTANLS